MRIAAATGKTLAMLIIGGVVLLAINDMASDLFTFFDLADRSWP